MKQYRVRYEYRGHVWVDVEAETEEQAERAGRAEADEAINMNLEVYSVDVKDKRP